MSRITAHPENLDAINSITITEEIRDFVANTAKDVESEKTKRAPWETEMDKLKDLRYGYRKQKTFPWKKAANYSIPLIDTHINSIKPAYSNLTFGMSPICSFEPFGAEDIEPMKKREVLFDWRMRTKVKFFIPYNIGVDKMLERGSVVFKIVWNYSTRNYTDFLDLDDMDETIVDALKDERVTDDMLLQIMIEELGIDPDFEENIEAINKAIKKFKEGETEIELDLIEVKDNQPEVTTCDIKEDLMVPIDTTDIQEARFVDQPFWRTTNQVKVAMRDNKYEEYDDETIASWGSKQGDKNTTASKSQDDMLYLHETCVWYDINDDGIKERCIATWPDATPSEVLRFIEIPYDHGKFPYEQVRRELNDAGFYSSRGIPELDRDYQVGISQSINQAEDNGTIVNRPVIVTKRNTVTNFKNRRYVPGEVIETNGDPNDYQIRQFSNASQPALFQFAQYLKGWADQRIGNITSGLSNPTNLPGLGQGGKKTAKEVDVVSALQGTAQAHDLLVFQQQIVSVYEQIDALYDQYGDDEEEVIITNESPMKINRREIQGKYNIVPNGRLDNTDPAMRAQKAFNLVRIFGGDPDVKQYELKKTFLTDYDHRLAKKLLYTEEERAQMEEMKKQSLEAMKNEAISQGIDMKQIDIMLEVYKAQLMTPIEGRKFAPG